MNLTCVTFDCRDPTSVARFWAAALQWDDVRVGDGGSGATCHPPSGGAYLEFVRVPEAKSSKNRLHLGCNAGPYAGMDAEIARLESLGATFAWEEKFPPTVARRYRNVVMRDVEGNEFCLGAGDAPGSPE